MVGLSLTWAGAAGADGHADFDARIAAAMERADRPAEDKARDANRLPKETLAFLGIDQGDRVLELLPGGGWYTRLLAPALDETGQLFLGFAARTPEELLNSALLRNTKVLEVKSSFEPTDLRGVFHVAPFDFGVKDLDAVLTFRNLHNLDVVGRKSMNDAAFAALKSGGVYGVVDHTRRHNEADNGENRRRLDPVLVIAEVQAAGFVLEASSELHYRAADPLLKEVGDESVTGKTDRFTFRFRKP